MNLDPNYCGHSQTKAKELEVNILLGRITYSRQSGFETKLFILDVTIRGGAYLKRRRTSET